MDTPNKNEYDIKVIDIGPRERLRKSERVKVVCARCGSTLEIPGALAVKVYDARNYSAISNASMMQDSNPECPICKASIVYSSLLDWFNNIDSPHTHTTFIGGVK